MSDQENCWHVWTKAPGGGRKCATCDLLIPVAEKVLPNPPEVRVTSSTGGQKGQKKARFDLIPGDALWEVAEVYGAGAAKYEDRNWEKGYPWSLSFAALQRHSWQFWNGEDVDPESGVAHMASVAFHALALLAFMKRHADFDDRPNVEST